MPEKRPPPPFTFGEPEKRNWLGLVLPAVFIAFGIAAIVWMVMASPREHKLTCRASADGQWNAIGRCTEE